jgi:hypothetical protein
MFAAAHFHFFTYKDFRIDLRFSSLDVFCFVFVATWRVADFSTTRIFSTITTDNGDTITTDNGAYGSPHSEVGANICTFTNERHRHQFALYMWMFFLAVVVFVFAGRVAVLWIYTWRVLYICIWNVCKSILTMENDVQMNATPWGLVWTEERTNSVRHVSTHTFFALLCARANAAPKKHKKRKSDDSASYEAIICFLSTNCHSRKATK